MQPDLIITPFGESADPGTIRPIPESTGPSDPKQNASWEKGFPSPTMTPISSGGVPPEGPDMNGVLNAISQHTVFTGGGGQYRWSDEYVAAKGGYAKGSVIQSDNGDASYVSAVDNNTINFNTSPGSIGTQWVLYCGPLEDEVLRQQLAAADGAKLSGVQQLGTGARVRNLLEAHRDFLRIDDFVTYGDGRDETVAIQAAINAALSQGKTLIGRPGWTVGVSSTWVIDCNSTYDGLGMNIIPVGMSNNTVVKINGQSQNAGAPKGGGINGLRCVVPIGSSNNTGVQVGDTTGSVNNFRAYGWEISGHATNLKHAGNNLYIHSYTNCTLLSATVANYSYECVTNSGENISFSGGNNSNAHNDANTALGVSVKTGVGAPDIRLNNVSMSYNDFNGDIATGIIEVIGCHEENRNVNPFWRLRNTSGAEKTIFTKVAGTLSSGPLGSGGTYEPAEGRDCLISYDGSVSVTVRDAKLGTFRPATGAQAVADYVTKVAKHSGVGGAAYLLSISGMIDANNSTGIPPDICPATSMTYLTGADAFSGFTKNAATGITFSSGSDGSGDDTRSRIVSSSTGTTGSYNLRFPCRPGQNMVAKVSAKTVGATAATYVGGRLLFFSVADVQVGSADLARTITSPTNAAYVRQFARVISPVGTSYAILQMYAGNLNGEAHFSNEQLWLLD